MNTNQLRSEQRSTGYWAGQSAGNYALQLGSRVNQRTVRLIGKAAVRSQSDRAQSFNPQEVTKAVQSEVIPYDRNLFRTERGLVSSLDRLHDLWREVRNSAPPTNDQAVQAREAAAMVATARWMYSSALARTETRGMHKHQDYPQQDPNQQHRLLSGGLDTVWVKPEKNVSKMELVTL